ncbi:MAG: hypothetical protein MUD01_14745 [Chloroflexaceae bacterium]|jgi:hypothetical protein|nr:hypothetical protein [Chloroflexaceae bacterium]
MTTLDISVAGELRLTLHGAAENRILATLRRWPHWQDAHVERDPANTGQCIAVTLVTSRSNEATLREILLRSFGLRFPPEGGSCDPAPEPAAIPRRRGTAGVIR